jgi:hypothetical protein
MSTLATFTRAFHARALIFRSRLVAAGSGVLALAVRSAVVAHGLRRAPGRLTLATRFVARSWVRRSGRAAGGLRLALAAFPHVRRTGSARFLAPLRAVATPHVKRRAPASVGAFALTGAIAGTNVSSVRVTSAGDIRVTSAGDTRVTFVRS